MLHVGSGRSCLRHGNCQLPLATTEARIRFDSSCTRVRIHLPSTLVRTAPVCESTLPALVNLSDRERAWHMALRCSRFWIMVALSLAVAGCSGKKKKPSEEELRQEVREAFTQLKEAISLVPKGNLDRIWDILSSESRDAAHKKAKKYKEEFAKMDPEEQAASARDLGYAVDDIKNMRGKGYLRLKSDKFYEQYLLVVAAPAEEITIKGDEAKVFYRQDESEHDKRSIRFVREDGDWKALLDIP